MSRPSPTPTTVPPSLELNHEPPPSSLPQIKSAQQANNLTYHQSSLCCLALIPSLAILLLTVGLVFSATFFIMDRILERYERYSYAEREIVTTELDPQGNWSLEYAKLKAKIEILQKNQRHFMGEDLETMSLKELQNLEQQLDTALKQIRSRKNQLMYESISELQRKEKALQEQNKQLGNKLKEKEKEAAQWENQNQNQNQNQSQGQNSPSFLLSQSLPSLNIGGNYPTRNNTGGGEEEGNRTQARTNSLMPPWMLRHVNE